jgi:intraflagellar transport protein 80
VSRPLDHVVTSVAWNPNGSLFAVGSYNLLRICDKVGWTHCRERKSNIGSMMQIAWTPDGTQFACATGSGNILFAQVIDRHFEWRQSEVTLLSPKRLRVKDVMQETEEEIELAKDRVVEVGVGFEHLIVLTSSQCYIYTLQNLNTPIILEMRAPAVFVHLCKRHFLTVDLVSGLQVISYEGRLLSAPKHPSFRADFLTREITSLAADSVSMVDTADRRWILFFDSMSGRLQQRLFHTQEIVAMSLNQVNQGLQERMVAFLDVQRELFVALPFLFPAPTSSSSSSSAQAAMNNNPHNILSITNSQAMHCIMKMHTQIDSFSFHDEHNALAAMMSSSGSEAVLHLFYHPECAFVDRDLLTTLDHTTSRAEFDVGSGAAGGGMSGSGGGALQLLSFSGTRIALRKIDGAVLYVHSHLSEVQLFDELVRAGKWEEACRLCRAVESASSPAMTNSPGGMGAGGMGISLVNHSSSANYGMFLWASLAGLSMQKKQWAIAETAYAALHEAAKVEFLQNMQQLSTEEGKQAAWALFRRAPDEAERICLQANPPLFYRAIKINLDLFRWQRALDVALKYKVHLDLVLAHRQVFLEEFGQIEQDSKYLQAISSFTGSLDVQEILERDRQFQQEEESGGGTGGDRTTAGRNDSYRSRK